MLGACVPSLNPVATLVARPWGYVAGPNGVIFDRFGFADPLTGLVSNLYSAGQMLGVVLPQRFRYARNGWNLAVWSNFRFPGAPCPAPTGQPPYLTLRAGMMVDLASQGNFIMPFPGGTIPGQQVYANVLDGTAWTGVSGASYLPTQWTTLNACGPNGRVLISSYTPPF